MAQTILLVDDHSGERAVELAKDHPGPIDVLLADVVMPGMDGFEVARSVRRLRPSAQVLFMSGHLGNAYAENMARSEGSFLPKPFAAADLRQALDGFSAMQEPRPPPGSAHSAG